MFRPHQDGPWVPREDQAYPPRSTATQLAHPTTAVAVMSLPFASAYQHHASPQPTATTPTPLLTTTYYHTTNTTPHHDRLPHHHHSHRTAELGAPQASLLTVLVYLNDDFQGGETVSAHTPYGAQQWPENWFGGIGLSPTISRA